ncbi:unnamed protein product [Prunus armeniaca]|uniref:Histone H2A n=1 Tax=Prunus armeniaca TaxID=36596 RepID=A0A6J5UBK0_PRUAR|nr:unnamed protein product [Prunus armeniaca]
MGINPHNPRSNFGVLKGEKLIVAVILGGGEIKREGKKVWVVVELGFWVRWEGQTRNVIGDKGLEVLARSCKRLRRLRIERGAYEQGMEDEEGVVSLSCLILELERNAACDNKKTRISPRHVLLAVKNDEELEKLLKGVTIASGGVLPQINLILLPKEMTSSKASSKAPKLVNPTTNKSSFSAAVENAPNFGNEANNAASDVANNASPNSPPKELASSPSSGVSAVSATT